MKEKIIKVIRENGFLIFLFICVCLVAVGTLSIALNGVDKGGEDKNLSEDLIILNNAQEEGPFEEGDSLKTVEGIRNSSLDLHSGEITLDEAYELVSSDIDLDNLDNEDELLNGLDEAEEVFYEDDEEDYDEIEFIENYVEDEKKVATKMLMPVSGEIITDFAKDKLIYSETLEEWRGHSGIDIKAEIGSPVIAVLDGIVVKVYEDSLWGKTIVIDHGDNLETKYSNLGTLEMVKEGIEVRQGDNIATVGKSAQIELLMEDHLHFEVIKNQKTADPRSIIK